jgi:hypothetical protein
MARQATPPKIPSAPRISLIVALSRNIAPYLTEKRTRPENLLSSSFTARSIAQHLGISLNRIYRQSLIITCFSQICPAMASQATSNRSPSASQLTSSASSSLVAPITASPNSSVSAWALRVASDFPQVVDNEVFVSGASTPIPLSEKTATSQYLPHAAWLSQRIEWLAPRPLIRSLMDGTDLPRPTLGNCSLELNRQIFAPEDSKWPSPWPARTLIVAAGKGGLLPTEDNADTARRLAEIGRKGNCETLAVVHYDMRHPWSLQAPELFAKAVDAWFREGKVLDKFVPL